MLNREDIQDILTEAMQLGADYAELYQQKTENCSILFENNHVDKIASGGDAGMGLRVILNGKTRYAHTNVMTRERGLDMIGACMADEGEASDQEAGSVRVTGNEDCKSEENNIGKVILNQQKTVIPVLQIHPNELSLDEKIEMLELANRTAREIGEVIRQVSISYGETVQEIDIASCNGNYTREERITVRMSCRVIAADGDHMETGYASLGGCCGLDLFSQEQLVSLAENAANQAITLLHAKPCPGGVMPVILSSEAGGTMVHEACGHGLEGDLVLRGMSVYAGKIGQKVASEKVTVYDDGSIAGSYGSYAFDDEGNASCRNILIDHGILKQYLCDLKTANELGMEPTGNGRRESYRYEPVTRMSNTFIASGTDDVDAMLQSVDYGLYVRHMGGGQVDTLTGNYVFDVSEGYLIENGKITTPVRGATLIGNGPESLMQIEMVGSDMGTAIGTCGKFGQGVPVGDGQPTILIRGLTVGGTVKA